MSNEKIINFTKWPTCRHSNFIVDVSLQEVECGKCGQKLNPMFVIERMANEESRERGLIKELKEEIEKSRSKMRCKCEHCKKMTRIAR